MFPPVKYYPRDLINYPTLKCMLPASPQRPLPPVSCHYASSQWKTPPPGKFTVASVCALLTSDLFTIAKFLVLFLFLLFNLNQIPDVALRINGQICDGCRRQAEEGKYWTTKSVSYTHDSHEKTELRTTGGESMYHGGPAVACCTFKRNLSAKGPVMSAAVICYHNVNTRNSYVKAWFMLSSTNLSALVHA